MRTTETKPDRQYSFGPQPGLAPNLRNLSPNDANIIQVALVGLSAVIASERVERALRDARQVTRNTIYLSMPAIPVSAADEEVASYNQEYAAVSNDPEATSLADEHIPVVAQALSDLAPSNPSVLNGSQTDTAYLAAAARHILATRHLDRVLQRA